MYIVYYPNGAAELWALYNALQLIYVVVPAAERVED